MASDYDPAEFVDGDFQAHKPPNPGTLPVSSLGPRAPSREEVDTKVAQAQQRLADLKRAQEDLERERASLEETRRRQMEFQTGREEMIQSLTRGVGLLEQAEFNSRRDADQMTKALTDLREALAQIQAIREETWTKDSFPVELTRALTTLENARMEWNAARLKFAVLSGELQHPIPPAGTDSKGSHLLTQYHFIDLCRIGFALTWPLALVALTAFVTLLVFLLRR
jgi:hypothetical protein